MKKLVLLLGILCSAEFVKAQNTDSARVAQSKKSGIRYNLNDEGSHYFQVVFLNQVWLRYNQSNPGTTQFSRNTTNTFDIGLRRTRIQMFGQITDRAFLYFQFGQNNFNSAFNYTSNRKLAPFFHDAVCEYRISKGIQLKAGAGLTIINGLSRFSQPSIGTIMTLDVPVFLQYTVDQTDQFDRRLAAYIRGQVSKLDYRFYVSNPFPVNSSGQVQPGIGKNATFVNTAALPAGSGPGVNNQFGTYIAWNMFEMEPHTTPYAQGTYLGTKRIWNIAAGAVYQKSATWNLIPDNSGVLSDTAYNDMIHFSVESFLDIPLNKEKGSAINAMGGYYVMNYGDNYIRYNGLMNPATASTLSNAIAPGSFGNAYPMFGSGRIFYGQLGVLFPKKLLGSDNGQLLPYLSAQHAEMQALQGKPMLITRVGLNWLMSGHQAKLSVDLENRPTFYLDQGNVKSGPRKNCLIIQYQISI